MAKTDHTDKLTRSPKKGTVFRPSSCLAVRTFRKAKQTASAHVDGVDKLLVGLVGRGGGGEVWSLPDLTSNVELLGARIEVADCESAIELLGGSDRWRSEWMVGSSPSGFVRASTCLSFNKQPPTIHALSLNHHLHFCSWTVVARRDLAVET